MNMSSLPGILLVAYTIAILVGLTGCIEKFRPYRLNTNNDAVTLLLTLVFMMLDIAAFIIGFANIHCETLTSLAWIFVGIIFVVQLAAFTFNIVRKGDYTTVANPDTLTIQDKTLLTLNAAACLLHTGSSLFMAPWVRLPLRCMEVTEWIAVTTWTTSQWVGAVDGTQVDCSTEQCIVTQCTTRAGPGLGLESMTFAFHFGSALAHWYFYYQGNNYIQNVKEYGNPVRWIEYAITASLMIVVIMVSCGFTDVWVLLCSAALTAVTQAFGWLAEISVQNNTLKPYTLRIFGIGAFAALPPWIAIIWMFIKSALKSDEIPWFVPAIIFTLFVLFSCFAAIMWLRLTSKEKDANITAEKRYVVASLVSKFLLAWLLWGGVFSREANDLQQAELPPC